jgi:hypothetical protein
MISARFFNVWAVAILVIGVVRFIQAWLYSQGLAVAVVQLVAVGVIACFLWLVGRSLGKPEFIRAPLRVWIVGLSIFAIAFVITNVVLRLIAWIASR